MNNWIKITKIRFTGKWTEFWFSEDTSKNYERSCKGYMLGSVIELHCVGEKAEDNNPMQERIDNHGYVGLWLHWPEKIDRPIAIAMEKPRSGSMEFPSNKAVFTDCGWCSVTTVGMCWWLFEDEQKQMNPSLVEEAQAIVDKVVETGRPPFGGWR